MDSKVVKSLKKLLSGVRETWISRRKKARLEVVEMEKDDNDTKKLDNIKTNIEVIKEISEKKSYKRNEKTDENTSMLCVNI